MKIYDQKLSKESNVKIQKYENVEKNLSNQLFSIYLFGQN